MLDNKPQEEREDASGYIVNNQQYVNNTPFMMMRLNTHPLLEKIENFLSSKKVDAYQDAQGEYQEKVETIGLPLANPEGIMRLCNIISMRINLHIVQGNFKEEHYWDFISRARKELTNTIIKKCYDWEIDDSNIETIIDEVCALIEAYMTRPINNKERDAYNNQIQSRESIVQQTPKQSWMNTGMGRRGGQI